jgi:hypothetical protein
MFVGIGVGVGWQRISFVGLLDIYPNAAAAYSVRKLRNAYTGNAIRVRRSSDNTEQNIGFVNNELDITSLTSFCGAGNGFVTTWYDQSGNGKNATQSTAASQPLIVSNGSVILEGTKPAIDFQSLDFLSISATAANGVIGVYKTTSIVTVNYIWEQNTPSFNGGFVGGAFSGVNGVGVVASSLTLSMTNNETIYSLGFWSYNGTNYEVSHNGSSLNSLSNTIGLTNLVAIGRSNGLASTQFLSKCNEVIFWTNSIATNKSDIETNINNYYGIY